MVRNLKFYNLSFTYSYLPQLAFPLGCNAEGTALSMLADSDHTGLCLIYAPYNATPLLLSYHIPVSLHVALHTTLNGMIAKLDS